MVLKEDSIYYEALKDLNSEFLGEIDSEEKLNAICIEFLSLKPSSKVLIDILHARDPKNPIPFSDIDKRYGKKNYAKPKYDTLCHYCRVAVREYVRKIRYNGAIDRVYKISFDNLRTVHILKLASVKTLEDLSNFIKSEKVFNYKFTLGVCREIILKCSKPLVDEGYFDSAREVHNRLNEVYYSINKKSISLTYSEVLKLEEIKR